MISDGVHQPAGCSLQFSRLSNGFHLGLVNAEILNCKHRVVQFQATMSDVSAWLKVVKQGDVGGLRALGSTVLSTTDI